MIYTEDPPRYPPHAASLTEDAAGVNALARRIRADRKARSAVRGMIDAHPTVLATGNLLVRWEYVGGVGGSGDFPLKTVNASDSGGLKVRVIPGVISFTTVPTIAGTPISADPPPTLAVGASGFVVLETTWADDELPRMKPLTATLSYVAGDPDAGYTPSPDDSTTSARLALAHVWVDSGKIARILPIPSGNITIERQMVDYGDYPPYFVAYKS